MKVIFNSDILNCERLVTNQLPSHLREFIQTCESKGHVIIIPLTTQLEFTRKQSELHNNEIRQLEKAYSLLNEFGIKYKRLEPSELIKQPDLIKLIESEGAKTLLCEPTHEELKEAHKRACLHECPHPLGAKSDEMRDLVIWLIALRLASEDGQALLISRDVVHIHKRGEYEASQVGLARVRSFEEALEYFEVLSPAGLIIQQLLTIAYDDLVKAGLPFDSPLSLISVKKPEFMQGFEGLFLVNCIIKAKALDGKVIIATVQVVFLPGILKELILTDVSVDNTPWQEKHVEIEINKEIPVEMDDWDERRSALREILGG